MQSLLSPGPRREAQAPAIKPVELPAPAPAPPAERLPISAGRQRILTDLQSTLREHGVVAELTEIENAMLEALTSRPGLCRGLLAAYLLER
jgi:hypothetical protein